MSETDIIKEFLVSLGYKVDQTGEKKFTDALTKGTKDALAFGATVTAAGAAIAAFTDKMASSVENLYFMSQRTGAAIANIQGFQYAATQLGSSAQDAAASLERMGEFLRYNPGSEGYLNSLGVQTRNLNGELLDTTKITSNLGKQLAQMPPYLQKAYGDFFGYSDKMLRAMTNGDYDRLLEDHNQRLADAGVHMQELGVQSHEYELAWRRLGDEVEIFADKRLTAILPVMTNIIKSTETWLEDLSSGTSKADQVKNGHYTGVGDYISKRGIGGALWDSLVQGLDQGGSAAKIVGTGISTGTHNLLGADAPGASAQRDRLHSKIQNWFLDELTPGSNAVSGTYDKGPVSIIGRNSEGSGNVVGNDKMKNMMNTLTGMGWTPQQAAGLLANFQQESGLDPYAVGDNGTAYGIGQWHADRQALFKQFSGHDIHQSTLDEQLRFANWELNNTEAQAGAALRGATTAGQAGSIASSYYERPADMYGQAALRSESAENIYRQSQQPQEINVSAPTTIIMNGIDGGRDAATQVENRMRTITQDITRNVAGAVQ